MTQNKFLRIIKGPRRYRYLRYIEATIHHFTVKTCFIKINLATESGPVKDVQFQGSSCQMQSAMLVSATIWQ